MISLRPLTARLYGKLGIATFESSAAETAEWAPGSEAVSPSIIQLPDEVDRVIAFNRTVTRSDFVARCEQREVWHPPTIARRYRNALVAHGSIYVGQKIKIVHQRERRLMFRERPVDFGVRMLATNFVSEQYFGHWLLDGISLELLAMERGIEALGLAREPWLQEPEYRVPLRLTLERQAVAQIEDLWVVNDRPMNGNHVARIGELRKRLRAGVVPNTAAAPIFLRREGGVRRPLINQDALANALARRGFTVLTPERETVDSLRVALHASPLVVSVEGSALCHAVANMAEGGTIVAIQPPRRVDWIQKVWADAAGLRLAQSVAVEAGGGSFRMEEDRLLRLFDLIADVRDGA